MTPEEILNAFATKIVISPPQALAAKNQAIEAIKQYAKQMCDKQKRKCLNAYGNVKGEQAEFNAINTAPYPSELQD
jgi:hypothetical protein